MIYTTDIWDDKTMKILVVQRTGAFFARRPIVSNFVSTWRFLVSFSIYMCDVQCFDAIE